MTGPQKIRWKARHEKLRSLLSDAEDELLRMREIAQSPDAGAGIDATDLEIARGHVNDIRATIRLLRWMLAEATDKVIPNEVSNR